jgi:hypothetical protein
MLVSAPNPLHGLIELLGQATRCFWQLHNVGAYGDPSLDSSLNESQKTAACKEIWKQKQQWHETWTAFTSEFWEHRRIKREAQIELSGLAIKWCPSLATIAGVCADRHHVGRRRAG